MRIYGTGGTAVAKSSTAARRSAAGGFSVGEQEAGQESTRAGSLRAISTVDALLALQGVEDFTARRKRAVARGRNALDALDALKAALLEGSVDRSALSRLQVAAEGLTDDSGDERLDAVMREIDLRVAVELAKAGVR